MRKTVTIMLVAVLALALVPAAVLLIPTVSAATPAITLAPTSQTPSASVSVAGTGFGATKAVGIGFGVEVNVINETMPVTGPFDVGTGPYIGYLSHRPIKPGTYTMSESFSPPYTTFIKMFDDAGNGSLIKASAISNASIVNATMNYVTSQFTVFTVGIMPNSTREGYVRMVNYTYYQYNVTPATNITADSSGSFTANIVVPFLIGGSYAVTAIDSSGNSATSSLTVGASSSMWSKTYGWPSGTEIPDGNIFQTNDGGYIVSGRTSSIGAGSYDAWLVKTDAFGNLEWNKTYGGAQDDRVQDMCKTSDGGYALLCSTNSFGAGNTDFWLIKVNAAGNVQWNKTYGGVGQDTPFWIAQTNDGGYAMVGNTNSSGAGGLDFWLVKTNASGDMQWNKTYGGNLADFGYNIIQTIDGGLLLTGYTASFGAGGQDVWLVKTDAAGNMQWNKTYGGNATDQGMGAVQTADGGYAITALTASFGAGALDEWLIKTDAAGTVQWNRTYGGPASDYGVHMLQTAEGGYIIAGMTTSFGAGGQDAWLIKTDASGNMLWSRTYGGVNNDQGWSLAQASDGGFIVAAVTESLGFGTVGAGDMLLVKTDAVGMVPALPAASAFTSVKVLPGWTWYFFVHSNGGAAPYTYQWYEGTTPIAGQTSMVLPVTKTTTGAYMFYCKVTDTQGMTVTSNTVTLTVMSY